MLETFGFQQPGAFYRSTDSGESFTMISGTDFWRWSSLASTPSFSKCVAGPGDFGTGGSAEGQQLFVSFNQLETLTLLPNSAKGT